MIIQVGSTEVLLSDAQRIAQRADAAGVACRLQVWENMPHVFQALSAWLPEAGQAFREIGAFVHPHLSKTDNHRHVSAHAFVVMGSSK